MRPHQARGHLSLPVLLTQLPREDEDMNLIEAAQKLRIVEPEVLTGRHHVEPGRVRAADLIRREAEAGEQEEGRTDA